MWRACPPVTIRTKSRYRNDGKTAYISNYGAFGGAGGGPTISVVDLTAQRAFRPIDLGALRAAHGLAFGGGKLYFTAEEANLVGRYDPSSQKIDWVMGTGQNRTHMVVVSKDLNAVFTSNVSSASVSILELGTVQPLGFGRGPGGTGGGAPGGVGRGRGGPPRSEWKVSNVAVGRGSEGFDLSPDGKELWVANAQDQTVSIVDVSSKEVVQTIGSTKAANRPKFTPDGKNVFMSDLQGNELLVFDAATRREFKKIALQGNSEGILIAPDGAHAYAAENSRDAVAVIDLKTMAVSGEVKTGRWPDGLAWAVRR